MDEPCRTPCVAVITAAQITRCVARYIASRAGNITLPHPSYLSTLKRIFLGTRSYAFEKSIKVTKSFLLRLAVSVRNPIVTICSTHPSFLGAPACSRGGLNQRLTLSHKTMSYNCQTVDYSYSSIVICIHFISLLE